jgi:hypothetical protein
MGDYMNPYREGCAKKSALGWFNWFLKIRNMKKSVLGASLSWLDPKRVHTQKHTYTATTIETTNAFVLFWKVGLQKVGNWQFKVWIGSAHMQKNTVLFLFHSDIVECQKNLKLDQYFDKT